MGRIITPPKGIYALTGTARWNPLTGPIPTTEIAAARFGIWLGGIADVIAQPAWQLSEDGLVWGTVATKAIQTGASYATAAGWTWSNFSTYEPIVEAPSTVRAFVRFGVMTLTSVKTDTQGAMARLAVMYRPTQPGSVEVPVTRVWTLNTTDFVALTGPIDAANIANVRVQLQLNTIGPGVTVQAGWQSANEPEEPADWSAVSLLGSAQTTDGLFANGLFTAITPTGRFLRFGVKVTGTAPSQSCDVRAVFDWR